VTVFIRSALFAAALAAGGIEIARGQEWIDRSEYDLVLGLRSQTDAAKRIALLDNWKLKYPKSHYGRVRAEMLLSAAESLNDAQKMKAAARELVAADPNDFLGVYWLTIFGPQTPDPTPADLAEAGAAASKLIANVDAFLRTNKQAVPGGPAELENARTHTQWLGHRTLGWVALQSANAEEAEREFTWCLSKQPADAEMSSWMGTALALEDSPAKQPQSIWHLSRASYL
jgi:hypothetical protein